MPQPSRSVIVAYVTAGAGHRRAAEAVAQALRQAHPDWQVDCHDVLLDAPRWFRLGYAATYLFLVRHAPWIWRFSYRMLDGGRLYPLIQPLRRRWNLFIVRRFIRRLKQTPPDVIVTTHFLPSDVCSAGKEAGWLKSKLVVVVTDYHPHRFWISSQPEAMVASVPESATVLTRYGVDAARIHVLGIPVGASFSELMDLGAIRSRLGLEAGRLAVLVTSGGTTVGQFEQVVEAIVALEAVAPGRFQLLIVCGEDAKTQQRLIVRAAKSPMPMRVFGFVDYMADLMAVAGLVVSKAGGLTVSESLSRGVPLVLYHVIPGQEQMNAEYIARMGAAVIARKPAAVARAVLGFMEDAAAAARMRQAALGLRRPQAAREIVTQVIEPLLSC